MTPILIFKDERVIKLEKDTLKKMIPVYQNIYNSLKALGINPTLKEINTLVYEARSNHTLNFVSGFVLNKLVDNAMPYVVNGVAWPRNKVLEIIELPNIKPVIDALSVVAGGNFNFVFVNETKHAKIHLLDIVDNKIVALPNAITDIEAEHCHYTTTEKSAKLATDLQLICDAINNFDSHNDGFFFKYVPTVKDTGHNLSESTIPGLAACKSTGKFILSKYYIKYYENNGVLQKFF
jgi:prolyl-tRNA synthetase